MAKEKTGNIFQQFILNSEELVAEVQGEGQSHLPTPCERWEKVKRILQARGFVLLCNQSTIGGVPTEVIVGIPADCLVQLQIKDHFYKLTAEAKLPFKSGEWYLEEVGPRVPKDLLTDENYQAYVTLMCDDQWFKDHLGKFLGFVDGKVVVEGTDKKDVQDALIKQYPSQPKFLTQVLAEEYESVVKI